MDENVEHSHWSWLGDFMQLFLWWPPFVRALEFLYNFFLPGVCSTVACKNIIWDILKSFIHWNLIPSLNVESWNQCICKYSLYLYLHTLGNHPFIISHKFLDFSLIFLHFFVILKAYKWDCVQTSQNWENRNIIYNF